MILSKGFLFLHKTNPLKIIFRLLTVIFILLIASCSNRLPKVQENNIFRYNESAGISSLDPAFSNTYENLWVVNQLFEGLVQLDNDLKVIPSIASDWTISEDGKIYTFHLRDDVYFHGNKELEKRIVTADDFIFSFQRIIDSKTASPGKWVFNKVSENGFSAPDKHTLVIRLSEIFPPFLGILTMKYCSVVSPEAVAMYGDEFRTHPVGTGPFVYHFWVEGEVLAMLQNPDYYLKDEQGNNLPYLQGISVSFNKDLSGVFLDFLKGKYDMLQGAEGNFNEELLDQGGNLRDMYASDIVFRRDPWLKTDYLGFMIDSSESENNPFLDVRVRRAINLAINRKLLSKALLNNLGTPALGGFIPEGFAAHRETDPHYIYKPGDAARLIVAAGYGLDNQLQIELNTTANYAGLAQFIQHELNQVGIDLKVNILDAGNLNENVAQSNLLFFKKSWLADYPDEENFMALFYSKNFSPDGPNYTHFSNEKADALYREALSETSRGARIAKYREMDRIIAELAPVVPLFYGQAIKYLHKNVEGLPSSPVNMLDLRRVSKSSGG